MAQNGYLTARIYTSASEIPIRNAIITVTQNVGGRENIIAKRTTDRNGQIAPVIISAPDSSLSLEPNNDTVFTMVDVRIDHPYYYTTIIRDVQIFGGQTTVVDTAIIPLAENQEYSDRADQFTQTPQNL